MQRTLARALLLGAPLLWLAGGTVVTAGAPVSVLAVEEAVYRLKVRGNVAEGEVLLSGRLLGDGRSPLPLFGPETIVSRVSRVRNGALTRNGHGLCFVPREEGPFQVGLRVLAPVRTDGRSKFVRLRVPESVRNVVSVDLPDRYRLVDPPGVAGRDGAFYFASAETLEVRFREAGAADAEPRVDRAALGTVSTPQVVLDALHVFTAFEEGGGALSVLVADVPPEAGAWLSVSAVPGAEIWYLKVNGKRETVYTRQQGRWMLPLAAGRQSRVELAFLRKGEKLDLRGQVATEVPATGIPTRCLYFGVALPERVDLMAVEGNLEAARGDGWSLPKEFVGKRHFFVRHFYDGAGMKAAFSYEQPFGPNATNVE